MAKKEILGYEPVVESEKLDLSKIDMLHTHVVNENTLEMIKLGVLKTLELDISSREGGYYIGHHELHYQDINDTPPHNVTIQEAMEVILSNNVFVKFDCKDSGAIPEVLRLAAMMPPNKCMLFAFAIELDFQIEERESHWKYENIPLSEILKLREEAGDLLLQIGCRGFTYDGIRDIDSSQTEDVFRVFKIAQENSIEVISFSLPDNQVPPDWILQYFHDGGILVEVYKDSLGDRELPCDVFTSVEVSFSTSQ